MLRPIARPRTRAPRAFTRPQLIAGGVVVAAFIGAGTVGVTHLEGLGERDASRAIAEQFSTNAVAVAEQWYSTNVVGIMDQPVMAGLSADAGGLELAWGEPSKDGRIVANLVRDGYCTAVEFPAKIGGEVVMGKTVEGTQCTMDGANRPVPEPAPLPKPTGVSYVSAVMQDQPQRLYRLDGTGTTQADTSGNGLDLDTSAGERATSDPQAPYSVASLVWDQDRPGFLESSAPSPAPTQGTLEAWVYLTENPVAETTIAAFVTPAGAQAGTSSELSVTPAGRIVFRGRDASPAGVHLTSAEPLTVDTWHHVVGTWGPAGVRIRVDRRTVAERRDVVVEAGDSAVFRIHGSVDATGRDVRMTGAMKLADVAFYPAPLADARTDAHYKTHPSVK